MIHKEIGCGPGGDVHYILNALNLNKGGYNGYRDCMGDISG